MNCTSDTLDSIRTQIEQMAQVRGAGVNAISVAYWLEKGYRVISRLEDHGYGMTFLNGNYIYKLANVLKKIRNYTRA